jgi:Ca2+-binding RTX toxin-like protein
MASFTVSTEVLTAQTLGLGEAGAVTPNGNLMVTSQDSAVSMTDFAFLTVSGSIFSSTTGVDSLTSGYVTVGATGVITASNTAIHLAGGPFLSTINNRGIIYAGLGIVADTGNLTVSNAGQITGDGGAAIRAGGGSVINVMNSGDILGSNYGIVTEGTSKTNVTNAGIVYGVTGALSLSNGVSVVVNTGTLSGKSLLGGGADVFNGTGGVQGAVYGGTGADIIRGGLGDDALFGDAGADVVRGNVGDDDLYGGADADVMYGGVGDDFLAGGVGIDVLRGGEGDDRLTGGTQVDTFVFSRNQGTDRVTDFQNGTDKLDLRAFDFASLAAVKALCSASSLGLRIDVPGEGVIFVAGLTLAQLNAADLLL